MRLIDADGLIEYLKEQAGCNDCQNCNGIKCRACSWDDAIGSVDDYADNNELIRKQRQIPFSPESNTQWT